jgi:hypothetical protein
MSGYDENDDGVWNESQWERHISEVEKKSKQLRKFIESGKYENLPSWVSMLEELGSEFDVVDEFVERELELEEAYYPDDDDMDVDEDDLDDDLFLDGDPEWSPEDDDELNDLFDEVERFGYADDEIEEGDEWKLLSEDYALDLNSSIMNLSIYVDARNLAALCVQEIDPTMVANYPIQYIQFVDAVMMIASKIASGFSFGFEPDMIGGNLVCTKKALNHANTALNLLQKQRKQPYIIDEVYKEFHRLLFELRNDIAIYVQDLRERFNAQI